MRRFVILIFIVAVSAEISAKVHPAVVDTLFKLPVKEKLDYRVYYKFSMFWAYAADATFSIDTITYENKKAYKLHADAFTRKKYRWVYSLEDHYTSITDYESFLPLRFEEHNIEKGINYDYIYKFNWETREVDMALKETDKEDRDLVAKLPDFITDSYSGVHYIRLLDYDKYTPSDTIEFESMLDGKVFKQQIVYLGKVKLEDAQGKEVDAFTIEAVIKNSSFFSKKHGIKTWIADSRERRILKVDANIIVGRIIMFLHTPGTASFDTHAKD